MNLSHLGDGDGEPAQFIAAFHFFVVRVVLNGDFCFVFRRKTYFRVVLFLVFVFLVVSVVVSVVNERGGVGIFGVDLQIAPRFGAVDAESNQEEFFVFRDPRALEAQHARDVRAIHIQGMITDVVLAPGSLVPVGCLHDAEVVSVTALDDAHIDAATIRMIGGVHRRSHMENSVNNNGSPECYKGCSRGERSSPSSEVYEGSERGRGQDEVSDES